MNRAISLNFPTYEDHQQAWEELAAGIAALKDSVHDETQGPIEPTATPGVLTIIGSGIESVGFALGDEKLIRAADKVLYCVADPATVVWLKRLRPDALDLYVLYGENKVRYTTYMQMTEAQLYWVRKGLNVVVVFYGHPGIFVLSTHRAIEIAKREGHRATMKAGVCALDTLCADLGIDPCHPGLQTHEATDSLTRQRRIDPTLHVILWQVGLIGELGYRHQGYLNSGFSIFVKWLISIYGSQYRITHYVGARYPTLQPLIAVHALEELYDPKVQATITGISTFYLPPRDVVPTDRETALELGLLKKGQTLVTPRSPLREIGLYGPREMVAFEAYQRFAIPKSYRWQDNTAASEFLIQLRFDMDLQERYRNEPLEALDDPRFCSLTERERQLLATRDSGAIQIAAKGSYVRSEGNEQLIRALLDSREACRDVLRVTRGKPLPQARSAAREWAAAQGHTPDWSRYHESVDYLYRVSLQPWTGVYVGANGTPTVTLIGNRGNPLRSVLYIGEVPIPHFEFDAGTLIWSTQGGAPFNGFLKLDLQPSGARRLIGKTWEAWSEPGAAAALIADSASPDARAMAGRVAAAHESLYGNYVLRSNGRFARVPTPMTLARDELCIAGEPAEHFELNDGVLSWKGGTRDFFEGEVRFLCDPVIDSTELYGNCRSKEELTSLRCYGARQPRPGDPAAVYHGPEIAPLAAATLAALARANLSKGGLLLWHKWEKAYLANQTIAQLLAWLA